MWERGTQIIQGSDNSILELLGFMILEESSNFCLHYARDIACVIWFNSYYIPLRLSQFYQWGMEVQRGSGLAFASELVNGEVQIWTQVCWPQCCILCSTMLLFMVEEGTNKNYV